NPVFRTSLSSLAHRAQESSEVILGDPQAEPRSAHAPWPGGQAVQVRLSQTCLLTHSDGDVVVPIVLGDQGHHRPVPGWVGGIDGNELLGAVLGEPVHLDGVAHGVGQKEHFNLGEEHTGVWREAPLPDATLHPLPPRHPRQHTARLSHHLSSSRWAQPQSFGIWSLSTLHHQEGIPCLPKDLCLEHIRNILQLNNKKANNRFKNWAKDLNRMAISPKKICKC
uniref:Uncharacterized protein n=1 Tax=Sus scrofa TaxID=9823 RepID=A0A8D2A429_PIG